MANFNNSTSNTMLNGTSKNDSFCNTGRYVTIVGGKGKDTVENHASDVTAATATIPLSANTLPNM